MSQSNQIGPPRGFRDILPTEARELGVIEQTLAEAFADSGFTPLHPPLLEYGAADSVRHRRIQFLDGDGSLVALRPDLTTSVARLVGGRYRDMAGVLRLSYIAPVFREKPAMSGGSREILQAGVELVGGDGALADAEILALLVESLERCGLSVSESTVQVGNIRLASGLFEALPDERRGEVLQALRRGDIAGSLGRAREAGMRADELERAARALSAVDGGVDGAEAGELCRVIELARERWPGNRKGWGVPNVALVPALPYYTGIVFEAVHPDAGVIASGGRYDLLSGAFGKRRPAIGFAIDVLQLHRALFAQAWRPRRQRPLLLLRPSGDQCATMRCAASLRAGGLAVALGDVAERAGRDVVDAQVIDERFVRLDDGRVAEAAALGREIGA
ncbi:MAG: ATP phosphoribosyltransferase regulatory subunit [Chloroflexota bacterium]|nr:ATP phosphoribosyltransferase regulatory subunit [Chloroflexota bacterium]